MATTKMQSTYKNRVIEWDDHNSQFVIKENNGIVKSGLLTIDACEKWIDKREKQKFKRTPVLFFGKWSESNNVYRGDVTSLVEGRDGGFKDVWVSSERYGREKKSISEMYLDTPFNRERFEEIESLRKNIQKIETEIESLKKSAIHLTAKAMTEGE